MLTTPFSPHFIRSFSVILTDDSLYPSSNSHGFCLLVVLWISLSSDSNHSVLICFMLWKSIKFSFIVLNEGLHLFSMFPYWRLECICVSPVMRCFSSGWDPKLASHPICRLTGDLHFIRILDPFKSSLIFSLSSLSTFSLWSSSFPCVFLDASLRGEENPWALLLSSNAKLA